MLQQKVLVVTNIPNPYRIPLFNELNCQCKSNNILVKVIFAAKSYSRRKFELDMNECKFDYQFLDSYKFSFGNKEKTFFTYTGLTKVIEQEKPDKIIVSGYSMPTIKLWFVSFFRPVKYIIWSGSMETTSVKHSAVRKYFRKFLLKKSAGGIAYGTLAKEYMIKLGLNADKIHIGINTTDIDFFKRKSDDLKNQKITGKKKSLLAISYLSKRKRVDLLIRLAKKLSQIRKDFELVIVGSGEEENKLKKMVRELDITDFVKFEGFRQKNELPAYLSNADCFLFSTDYDIWGISLIEAMASGLVCFSSIHSGATHDLIKEGETGFYVNFEETNNVAEKINYILNDLSVAAEIGSNARNFIVEKVTVEESVKGFIKAIVET